VAVLPLYALGNSLLLSKYHNYWYLREGWSIFNIRYVCYCNHHSSHISLYIDDASIYRSAVQWRTPAEKTTPIPWLPTSVTVVWRQSGCFASRGAAQYLRIRSATCCRSAVPMDLRPRPAPRLGERLGGAPGSCSFSKRAIAWSTISFFVYKSSRTFVRSTDTPPKKNFTKQ
jgi:hypothetical protein